MSEICQCPGCTETEETATLYEKPLTHEEGTMVVCGRHADFDKDGIDVLSVNDAPSQASKEILEQLKSE